MEITLAEKRDDSLIRELTALWRASVEATHDFLGPADVERIAEYVPNALREVPLHINIIQLVFLICIT